MRCLNCMKEFDEQYGVCPHCGHIPGKEPKEAYQLCQGVLLAGRYVIGTAVGVGGFGITYKAWDNTLQKMIAIKEYYPSANGIVNRTPGQSQVIVYSGERALAYNNGKIRFLAEARNMAKYNTHPNIVHVYDFFEENGTAYIAMEFLEGVSYKDFIASNGGRVEVAVALEVTLSVLDALKEIHRTGIIHRDVSPDNVFICQGGVIKLIDFGAARFSTGEEEKTLSIILKPGYAPPEQYRSRGRQGPWTDIYAVGAMFYRAVTGMKPEESVNRLVQDHVEPPSQINPDIPEYISNSIMRAMALNQELRFRNVDQFKEAIQNKTRVLDVGTELKRRKTFRFAIVGAVSSMLILAGAVCLVAFQGKRAQAVLKDARIVVWYPAGETQAGDQGVWEEDQQASEDESRFLSMTKTYEEHYPNIEIEVKAIPEAEYENRLREALAGGEDMPDVFDSTCLAGEFYGEMASLEDTYAWLQERDELGNYYFLNQYHTYFPEEKQMPLSFQVPVIYEDSLIADQELSQVSGEAELKTLMEADSGYAVSPDAYPAFNALIPNLEETGGYKDFVVNLENEATGAAGEEFDAEAARAKMLEGKAGYYLSDTSEYQMVQNDMAGIYKVLLLKDMPLKGRFSNLWSVYDKSPAAEKKAGVRLIYFLLSKENQQILNLQNSNGIPLHKEVFEEYETMNTEFEGLGQCLEQLILK